MSKYCLLVMMFLLMVSVGCVTIRVHKEQVLNKESGEIEGLVTDYKYSRWLGSQNIEGFKMESPEGGKVEVGKQNGLSTLDTTLGDIAATLKNISKSAAP